MPGVCRIWRECGNTDEPLKERCMRMQFSKYVAMNGCDVLQAHDVHMRNRRRLSPVYDR